MPPNPELPTTAILFIDQSKSQRTYWIDQLKACSADYEILEAADGQSGLDLYLSRRIDCVVLELELPDQSGFQTLLRLVPVVSRPRIAVIILTTIPHQSLWELARDNGAYACFYKPHTTGEDLDRAIQRAVSLIGQMPKEDRHRPL
jgi:DNA-binding NarL/FixJ family response regulator